MCSFSVASSCGVISDYFKQSIEDNKVFVVRSVANRRTHHIKRSASNATNQFAISKPKWLLSQQLVKVNGRQSDYSSLCGPLIARKLAGQQPPRPKFGHCFQTLLGVFQNFLKVFGHFWRLESIPTFRRWLAQPQQPANKRN